MSSVKVQQFLQDVQRANPAHHDCIEHIRAMLLALGADVSEEVKYGGLLFGTHQHFCGLFSYSEHVTVEFSEGAALADLYTVLEGNGKYRRHIKLRSPEDIEQKHVDAYVTQAYEHAQAS